MSKAQKTAPRKLTPRQQRFVDEYLVDLNASQAAIRAGYSQKTAGVIGHQLLKKTLISAAISAGKAERSQKTQIDAKWLIERLAAEATADVADLYDDEGNLKPIRQWPMVWRQGLVSGMDVERLRSRNREDDGDKREGTTLVKLKLSDRTKRLELIGKHIDVAAFAERHEHEHTGKVVTQVDARELIRTLAFAMALEVKQCALPNTTAT